jgi:hypothetical protein
VDGVENDTDEAEENRIKELVKAGEIDRAYREACLTSQNLGILDENIKQAVIEAISELLGAGQRGEAYEAFWHFELPSECARMVAEELVEKIHWSRKDALNAAKDLEKTMNALELSAATRAELQRKTVMQTACSYDT